MLLALFESARGRLADWVTTFGRVPFLYYIAHIYLIHLLAVVYAMMAFDDASFLFLLSNAEARWLWPAADGLYGVWLIVVVSLYPPCRWFAGLKQRSQAWWWSYL